MPLQGLANRGMVRSWDSIPPLAAEPWGIKCSKSKEPAEVYIPGLHAPFPAQSHQGLTMVAPRTPGKYDSLGSMLSPGSPFPLPHRYAGGWGGKPQLPTPKFSYLGESCPDVRQRLIPPRGGLHAWPPAR